MIVKNEGAGAGGGGNLTATYVTLSTDATLTNERVLTAGTNITLVDGGAGSTITINGATQAPTNATYVTTAAESGLSAETVLSTAIATGTLASRPAAAVAGFLYYATDEDILWRDSGSAWAYAGGSDPAGLGFFYAAGLCPATVYKYWTQTPDAFDATTLVTNETITPVLGGVEVNFAANTGVSIAAWNLPADKDEALFLLGTTNYNAGGGLTLFGIRDAAMANGNTAADAGFNAYEFRLTGATCDPSVYKDVNGTLTLLNDPEGDSRYRQFAIYYKNSTNVLKVFGRLATGWQLLYSNTSATDIANARSFYLRPYDPTGNAFYRYVVPIVIRTN